MKLPKWVVPLVLRMLSLSSFGSATVAGERALLFGVALSPTSSGSASGGGVQQSVSLDLDFFVQCANHQIRVPIMPL